MGTSSEAAPSRPLVTWPLGALAAWTLLAPPAMAGTIWLLFHDATTFAAAGAYLLLGYGAAAITLGGCAVLCVVTFVVALRGRRQRPGFHWVALAAAPVALVGETGLVWWLLKVGNLAS